MSKNTNAARDARAAARRVPLPCGVCEKVFTPARNGTRFCSKPCRVIYSNDYHNGKALAARRALLPAIAECAARYCDKMFKPTGKRVFCSAECGTKEDNDKQRDNRPARELPVRVCQYRNCAVLFLATRSDKVFCNEIHAAAEHGARSYAAGYRRPTLNPARKRAARERSKFWIRHNLDRSREQGRRHTAKRRALVKGNGQPSDYDSTYRGFGVFAEAGWWRAHGVDMQVDHWMPIKLGGRHIPENLTLLLAADNGQKSAKHPADWQPPAYYTDLPPVPC